MSTVKDAWCVYPGGYIPRIGARKKRIYDPRNKIWQEKLLDACRKTLLSYPYNGLFLDQLTVFLKSHPNPFVRLEMREALKHVVIKLRKEFPNAILVGNTSSNFEGLNGEMVENRPNVAQVELKSFHGHERPRVELLHTTLKASTDIETVTRDMSIAHQHQAYYGASVNYQRVLWFDQYDKIISKYKKP
jgi:hypothetical protein